MYRASIRKDPLPFFKMLEFDYTIQIYGSLRGGMLYLPDVMSVYRFATQGSWTRRINNDSAKLIAHRKKIEEMMICLDQDTDGQYSDAIWKTIQSIRFDNLYARREYKQTLAPEYREFFMALTKVKKGLVILGSVCPRFVDGLYKVYSKLKYKRLT